MPAGDNWLPKREVTHEVGRISRGHLPRSVSQRMIGSEKEGAHAVGRTSRKHVPHGVPQRMIGKGRGPRSGKDLPWPSASQRVPTAEPYLQKTSLTASRNL